MNNSVSEAVIANVKVLYAENLAAKELFNHLAARSHTRKATSIDRIAHLVGLSRGEAVALARLLEDMGCGEFKMGRRGQKSRFIWAFSAVSLGKAAIGEDDELQEFDDLEDIDTDLDDDELVASPAAMSQPLLGSALPRLTILEAREALAMSLGLPANCIEITIKTA